MTEQDDVQAFAEQMVTRGPADHVADVLEFTRQGRFGMALYLAGRVAQQAANRTAGSDLLTSPAQLIACLVTMRATVDHLLDLLECLRQ